jgi:NAD(P)-dependent dehydrogenase (short-subunit alcohol dehydrogenase family)
MNTSTGKIALIVQAGKEGSLSSARLLALEGYRIAITGTAQNALENAVENIGHGSLGLLYDPANVGGLFSICQKANCYFKGRIDLLLINTIQFSGLNPVDISNAFFTVQFALPYLNHGATVMLTSGLLTKKDLNLMITSPVDPIRAVRVYLEQSLLLNLN